MTEHAANAIFDLAVNRAAVFVRGAGPNAPLEVWQTRTRFASRVNLESVRAALEVKPHGDWFWQGGETGAWVAGKPRTP
jgi:transposase